MNLDFLGMLAECSHLDSFLLDMSSAGEETEIPLHNLRFRFMQVRYNSVLRGSTSPHFASAYPVTLIVMNLHKHVF